jgi:lipopolysaccharide transport system ATP-binding protein
VIIPPNLLSEGEYTVGVSIFTSVGLKQHYVMIKDAMFFQVFDSMIRQSARGDYAQNLAGVVRPLLKWNMYYEGQDRMTEEHMSSQRLNK